MAAVLRSRSGRLNPSGKCEARLDTPLPISVKEDLAAVATLMGKTAAEVNRELIEDFLYGKLRAVRLALSGRQDDGMNVR